MIAAMKTRRSRTETIPLKVEAFEQWAKQRELEMDAIASYTSSTTKFSADNHGLDKALLSSNSIYAKEVNKEWLKNITEDIYLQEAFSVLCDLIKLSPSKN